MKELNRVRAERVEAERTLEESDAVDDLRIEESTLQRNIDRLNADLGAVRTIVAMQREVEAKTQKLAAHITRARQMGCYRERYGLVKS